jgi:probable HAF family extracellular repeat protein
VVGAGSLSPCYPERTRHDLYAYSVGLWTLGSAARIRSLFGQFTTPQFSIASLKEGDCVHIPLIMKRYLAIMVAVFLGGPLAMAQATTPLISELKLNPPGNDDEGFQFVELQGGPSEVFGPTYYLIQVNGDYEGATDNKRGRCEMVIPLNGLQFGANGLMLLRGLQEPFPNPPGVQTTSYLVPDPLLAAMAKKASTLLIVTTNAAPVAGVFYDANQDHKLDGMTIVDCVGWGDADDANDWAYGFSSPSNGRLLQTSGFPDAVTRLTGNTAAKTVASWYFGDLDGTREQALDYTTNATHRSSNIPAGAVMTPGLPNFPTTIVFSGTIGETNEIIWTIPSTTGTLTVSSSDPEWVLNARLSVTKPTSTTARLAIVPDAVCYSVLLTVSDPGTYRKYVLYSSSAGGSQRALQRIGVSDASAAVTNGANFVFVAEDELNAIRLYNKHTNGPAVREFIFDDQLGVSKELDLEAATRWSSATYWLGSHSQAGFKNGVYPTEPDRHRVFRLDIGGSTAAPTLTWVRAYQFLRSDLCQWDIANGNPLGLAASTNVNVDPKTDTGFNLEGLTMTNSTDAFLGFRAPLVPNGTGNKLAILVLIEDFNTTFTANRAVGFLVPKFKPPYLLDLGGRGIRSIEKAQGANEYIIVAGPPSSSKEFPGEFAIYRWVPNQPPVLLNANLGGLNPEEVIDWNLTAGTATLMGDWGDRDLFLSGLGSKQQPFNAWKQFRMDRVVLWTGPGVSPIKTVTYTPLNAPGLCAPNTYAEVRQLNVFGIGAGVGKVPADGCTEFQPFGWNGITWNATSPLPPTSATPLSPSSYGQASGVNARGILVGSDYNYQPVYWASLGSSAVDLGDIANPPLLIDAGWVNRINDLQRVVGIAYDESVDNWRSWYGDLYSSDGLQELPRLNPGTDVYSGVYAINNRLWIVGVDGPRSLPHARLWIPNSAVGGYLTPKELFTPLPSGTSWAHNVNDHNQIVGQADTAEGTRACMWSVGGCDQSNPPTCGTEVFKVLDTPPGTTTSAAFGINNRGQVVGYYDGSSGRRACTWINGVFYDLSPLCTGGPTLTTAFSINDQGQICALVVSGGVVTTQILNPVNGAY